MFIQVLEGGIYPAQGFSPAGLQPANRASLARKAD